MTTVRHRTRPRQQDHSARRHLPDRLPAPSIGLRMDTMTLWHISGWGFAALAAAAVLVGFSKTAVSGANTVSLAIFAAVLPARASTGALLPILIAGDVLAVLTYRRHAHWPTLWRLFPAVAVGVVAGTLFLQWADDGIVRTSIGAILLFMAGGALWGRRGGGTRRGRHPDRPRQGPLLRRPRRLHHHGRQRGRPGDVDVPAVGGLP